MTGSLAIFVKTPGQSPVKTRLARHIGQLKAEAFHFSSAEAVASVAVIAGAEAGFKAHWAVAEPAAILFMNGVQPSASPGTPSVSMTGMRCHVLRSFPASIRLLVASSD